MRDYSKITKPTPEKYCAYCGAKLERKRYGKRIEDMAMFLRRKYCGIECMKRAFVKSESTTQQYCPAHHTARKVAYLIKEKPKVCEICGSTTSIDVHHKDGNHNNNDANNLMIVCRSCHMKLHRPKSKCKICGAPVKGHGYCDKHYQRFKKYGDPYKRHKRASH